MVGAQMSSLTPAYVITYVGAGIYEVSDGNQPDNGYYHCYPGIIAPFIAADNEEQTGMITLPDGNSYSYYDDYENTWIHYISESCISLSLRWLYQSYGMHACTIIDSQGTNHSINIGIYGANYNCERMGVDYYYVWGVQWSLRLKDTLRQPFCPFLRGCPLLGG